MAQSTRGYDAQTDRSSAERRQMLEVLDRLRLEPITRSQKSVARYAVPAASQRFAARSMTINLDTSALADTL